MLYYNCQEDRGVEEASYGLSVLPAKAIKKNKKMPKTSWQTPLKYDTIRVQRDKENPWGEEKQKTSMPNLLSLKKTFKKSIDKPRGLWYNKFKRWGKGSPTKGKTHESQ